MTDPSSVTIEQSAGLWIAVLSAAVTILATVYAMHRTWQQRRQDRVQRLAQAATLAVRRTESAYVRPILCEKLRHCLVDFVHSRGFTSVHAEWDSGTRFLLYCQLQETVRLTDEEKHIAQTLAVNQLVALLRSLPSPPLRVHTDRQVTRNEGRLREQIELAYSLRPRLSGAMIEQVGEFAAAAPVTTVVTGATGGEDDHVATTGGGGPRRRGSRGLF